jgi:hypothetical protein
MQHRRFILVIVPNEVALQLHDFELVVVHLGYQLRPDLHTRGEEIKRLFVMAITPHQ